MCTYLPLPVYPEVASVQLQRIHHHHHGHAAARLVLAVAVGVHVGVDLLQLPYLSCSGVCRVFRGVWRCLEVFRGVYMVYMHV